MPLPSRRVPLPVAFALVLASAGLAQSPPTALPPSMECRVDAQQQLLILDVETGVDSCQVTLLGSDSDQVVPASKELPAILKTDLVVATGQSRNGRFHVELPLRAGALANGTLWLQAVLTTPQGTLLGGPIRSVRDAAGGRGTCGVGLRQDAIVYAGHPCNCTRPGAFDFDRVRKATPEWRTIEANGIRPGTARHQILVQAMHERLVTAAREAARRSGCDLVVRSDDLADRKGLPVVDLTEAMITW